MKMSVVRGAALTAGVLAAVGLGVYTHAQQAHHDLGFKDTPFLPGGKWHVHDGDRPQPKVIDAGTFSTQETPGRPPSDAVVLFDGKDLSKWKGDKGPAEWKVENGYVEIKPGSGFITTKEEFGDCQLHVEFSEPSPPSGEGQGRGNSGVFLFGRYEIQVLDSFQSPTYPDGQASAIYGQFPPLVNASRAPALWQTYDIIFNGPRFQGDQVTRPAYATVLHNGVVVHNHTALLGPMVYRALAHYTPHGEKGPLSLQDHGNPVRFRNIWIRELKDYDQP